MENVRYELNLFGRIKRFWRSLKGQKSLPAFRTNVRIVATKLGINDAKRLGQKIYRTEEGLRCVLKDGKMQLLECFEVQRQNEAAITITPEVSEKKELCKYIVDKGEFGEIEVYAETPINFERAIAPEENDTISVYANLLANKVLSKLDDKLTKQADTLIGIELEGQRMLILDSIAKISNGGFDVKPVPELQKKDYILAINNVKRGTYHVHKYQKRKLQGSAQEARQMSE